MSGTAPPGDKANTLLAVPQFIGLLAVMGVLHLIAREQFLLFHTLVELLRILVLGGLFVLAWHTRHWADNHFLRVVGIAAVFIAGMELFHTLSYRGLGLVGPDHGNLPTQLWMAFRLLEASAFLLAALPAGRSVSPGRVLAGYASATLVLGGLIFTGMFPDAFREPGGLTAFKVNTEYLIATTFAVAMALLFARRKRFDAQVHWLIQASLAFNILATLSFTRYVSVYGLANEVGHYFLLISVYLIYRGVLVTGLATPYQIMFRDLKRHQEHLTELVNERTAALQQSEQLNQSFVENSPAILILHDRDGRITLANPAFEALAGKPASEIVGHYPRDIIAPQIANAIERNNLAAIAAGKAVLATEAVTLDNRQRLFEAVHFPLSDPSGQVSGTGAIATEVTEQRRLQANYELMVQASMDALVLLDDRGNFVQVNPAALALTGYSESELLTMNLEDIDAGSHPGGIGERLKQIGSNRSGRFESCWQHRNGQVREVELSVQVFDGMVTNGFCAFVRDISQQRADLRRIEFLARYDALTELPNRARFEELAQQRLQRAGQTGQQGLLVYIDLDNFKDINDSLGHYMGDALLRTIGQRLQALADPQRLFARSSGDEFIALLEVGSGEAAMATELARIQQTVVDPVSVNGHQLLTTVSVGVSVFPEDGQDFTTLYRNADTAMYAAKESGRNTWRRFDKAMQEKAFERQLLLAELRGALARGELFIHYQPQFNLASRELVGAEALLRWQHPELGLVSPARFIPIAEESGLIVDIGEWVLREVCRQGRAWKEAGLPPITLAVNLSAIQFQRPGLSAAVARILDSTAFDGRFLELELTESVLAGDEARVANTITQLRQYNVQVAIDDFGTGYSSMAYLNRFAVDKLKIDQSFVQGMETDRNSASVVTAIIRLAHSLDLRVIAEGVETEKQAQHLEQLDCDEVQGYLFSKPVAPAAFADLLEALTTQE
ncbi:EAL domain-containing protein [Marinobacter sp.]|uniref:bifunctional diguanylate cyclase/phosphodiesterase n=1 Tax=Marinobacter sp. TaxID=50741 RepID=UPI003565D5FA